MVCVLYIFFVGYNSVVSKGKQLREKIHFYFNTFYDIKLICTFPAYFCGLSPLILRTYPAYFVDFPRLFWGLSPRK